MKTEFQRMTKRFEEICSNSPQFGYVKANSESRTVRLWRWFLPEDLTFSLSWSDDERLFIVRKRIFDEGVFAWANLGYYKTLQSALRHYMRIIEAVEIVSQKEKAV